jgi:hypothetical protein
MRENHGMCAIDDALVGIEVNRNLAACYLIVAVVRDWIAGQDHRPFGLVHNAVITRRPSRALTQAHIAVGDHVLHLFEVFVEVIHAQLIAGECRSVLRRAHTPNPQNGMVLVVERHRLRADMDRGFAVAEFHPAQRTTLLRLI